MIIMTAHGKNIEKSCIEENLFFCFLRSTIKLNSMCITKKIILRFTNISLLTLRQVLFDKNDYSDQKFLWFNRAIKYQNKSMFIEEFYKAGIFDFDQLLKSVDQLYTYDEIATLFNLTPNNKSFITYIKLMSAIPQTWMTTNVNARRNDTFLEFKQSAEHLIVSLGKSNKTAYNFLRDKSKILPEKQQQKWCEVLQLPSDAIDWPQIYQNNFYATIETKLRSFQIRLNYRSIVTNSQLFGMEIVSNNLCSFCREVPETLIHLFCDCNFVALFWNDVFDWISARCNVYCSRSNLHKLFGLQEKKRFHFVNMLLLCARFLIYRCKINKTKPNINQYFTMLQQIKKSEFYIAKKKNKLDIHYQKWNI